MEEMAKGNRNETTTVEHSALQWFAELGWETFNGHDEVIGTTAQASNFGCTDLRNVFLPDRLRNAMKQLNPDLPAGVLERVHSTLTRHRAAAPAVVT